MGNVTASGTPMAIGDALFTAALGYSVVFFGLVLLMAVIMIVGKIMVSRSKKNEKPEHETASPAVEASRVKSEKAPGTAGGVMLYDTPERDAAMVMAIVADKMGKPLNELRFISVREVK